MHDRDALLRELYHRTQNTLQIVTAFARLRATTPEAEELALDLERRIDVISCVQHGLYELGDLNRIDLARVAARIADRLLAEVPEPSGRITLRLPGEACIVPIDVAMPAALALYEALANAMRHAFPQGRRGCVAVVLARAREDSIEMSVVDDGIGLPPRRDGRPAYNAGLSILLCLAEQLGGNLRLEPRDPGLAVIVTFPAGPHRGAGRKSLAAASPC